MAKKVEGYIKLQIPAGKATPAPPVGPALGQCKEDWCYRNGSGYGRGSWHEYLLWI